MSEDQDEEVKFQVEAIREKYNLDDEGNMPNLFDETEPHMAIIDRENIDFIADLSKRQYHLLTRLKVRATIFDDEMLAKAVEVYQAMSTSVSSRRVEQMIDMVRSEKEQDQDPNKFVDSVYPDVDTVRQKGGIQKAD